MYTTRMFHKSKASLFLRKTLCSKNLLPSAASTRLLLSATLSASILTASFQYHTNCDAVTQTVPQISAVELPKIIKKQPTTVTKKAKEVIRLVGKFIEYVQRLLVYTILGVPVVCVGGTAYALG
jgi:hypothetical protein